MRVSTGCGGLDIHVVRDPPDLAGFFAPAARSPLSSSPTGNVLVPKVCFEIEGLRGHLQAELRGGPRHSKAGRDYPCQTAASPD